jgi:signal transduction histidine kinase
MSGINSGYRRAENRTRGASTRSRRVGASSAANLAGLRQILRSHGDSALELAAEELGRALSCEAIITQRRGGETTIVARAGAPRLSTSRHQFLNATAQRLAAVSRALRLSGGSADGSGLTRGEHYLGLPAPRRVGADFALHLIRSTPFAPTQGRAARAAADALGQWIVESPPRPQAAEHEYALPPRGRCEAGGVAIEQLLSDAMRAAAETLGSDTCSLTVMDETKNALVVDAAYGLAGDIVRDSGQRPGEGVASYVMASGQPIILNDPAQDPRLQGLSLEPRGDIKCSICVPIELREGLRGVVSFNRTKRADPFTPDDLGLACTLAAQLGPCVANARMYQQAAARLDEVTAISRMAEVVTPTMDMRRVGELLIAGIAATVGIAHCRLYLLDGEELRPIAQHGYRSAEETPDVAQRQGAIDASARRRAVYTQAAVCGGDGTEGTAPRWFAAFPIVRGRRVLGVFSAAFSDRADADQLNRALLEEALGRGAAALENAVAHQRMRENLDDLYRLYDSVQRINTNFEPSDILKQVAHEIKLLTGCRRVDVIPLEGALAAVPRSGRSGLMLARLTADADFVARARRLAQPRLVPGEPAQAPDDLGELAADLADLTGGERAVVTPLTHERGSLGIVVGRGFGREPRARDLALAGALGAHSAALLRKALDYQAAISQRSLELSAIYQLCEEISTATSFESVLRSVLEIAHSMVDYDEGLVFIWREDAGRLELAACRGVDFDAIRQRAPQIKPGNMYHWVFAEGKAFITSDIGQLPGDGGRAGQVLRSAMAVPLVVGNKAIGVLAIHSARPQAYTEAHVKVVSIVASQAAAIYGALQSLGSLSRYTENILQSIHAGVIGLDRAGRVAIWSPAAARIFMLDASQVTGADLATVAARIGAEQGWAAGQAVSSLAALARRVMTAGEPALGQELRLERDGAPPRILLAGCTPLRAPEAELAGAVLLVEDITERKRMDDHVRQMSQLAAVGHLAANVAHEIRNPLSAIKAAAQFLSTEYDSVALVSQFAGIINEECDRLGKVATDFLTYARPNEPALERISLAAVVQGELAATAAEMAERKIEVSATLPRTLPKAWADPEAMRQVFVNLLLNAAQAIGSGGRITVSLRAVGAMGSERAIEAAVSDTGPGIPEESIERIWAPFYSTKTKGTGLGLSIVRKTVEAHGGQAWAESGCARGACLRLRVPISGRAPAGRAAAPAETAPAPRWRQLELFENHSAPVRGGRKLARAARQGAHS